MIWVILLTLLISELFVFTWSRVQCVATGYSLTRSAEEHNHLVALQKKLRIELAHLKSPNRISAIARNRLGLIVPEQDQIITIR